MRDFIKVENPTNLKVFIKNSLKSFAAVGVSEVLKDPLLDVFFVTNMVVHLS